MHLLCPLSLPHPSIRNRQALSHISSTEGALTEKVWAHGNRSSEWRHTHWWLRLVNDIQGPTTYCRYYFMAFGYIISDSSASCLHCLCFINQSKQSCLLYITLRLSLLIHLIMANFKSFILFFFMLATLSLGTGAVPLQRHGRHSHGSTFSRMMLAPHKHTQRASHVAARGIHEPAPTSTTNADEAEATIYQTDAGKRNSPPIRALLDQEAIHPKSARSFRTRFVVDDTIA